LEEVVNLSQGRLRTNDCVSQVKSINVAFVNFKYCRLFVRFLLHNIASADKLLSTDRQTVRNVKLHKYTRGRQPRSILKHADNAEFKRLQMNTNTKTSSRIVGTTVETRTEQV
jgi:hypothetical protein